MNAEIFAAIQQDVEALETEVFQPSTLSIGGREIPCIRTRSDDRNEFMEGGRWEQYRCTVTIRRALIEQTEFSILASDEDGVVITDENGVPVSAESWTIPMPTQGQNVLLDGRKMKVAGVANSEKHPVIRLDLESTEAPR